MWPFKKKKKVKVTKPTPVEQKEIDKRLAKKYPQMEDWWKDDAAGAEKELERRTKERVKKVKSKRTEQTERGLQEAGLSAADIARLRGKK